MAANRISRESRMSTETPRLPPTFNRLAWSNLAAQSAEQIALAAAPIVAVLLLGVGEGQTGLLQTALTLPFILFAIPAGLLADRISRRYLMAGAEALRAAALAATLLLIWLGLMTLPLLAVLGFVAVCGTVAYSVAAPALVPSLVTPQQLPAANARIELARTVALASGPALGGVLVGWVGAVPAFACATVLSVAAVVLLSGIYEPARQPAPRRHPLQDIKEGAAFVLHHPLLRPVFITQFIFNTAQYMLFAVFVPYAVRRLGLSASLVGTVLAMFGVGMVVGALLATRVMKRLAFVRLRRRLRDGADDDHAHAMAGCPELLPARRRPDPVGDLDHDLAPIGDAAVAAGKSLRDQHHELWRKAARLPACRRRRRLLRRRGLSLSRRRHLRRAGAGDPAVAGSLAGAAAGHGRGRTGAAGVLSKRKFRPLSCPVLE
jgi:predicted MFS family arabinose efflux permease